MSSSQPPVPSASWKRPLRILVSYSMDSRFVDQTYADALHALAQSAERTFVGLGDDIQVVFVDATHPYRPAEELIGAFDAVCILGGADIDPKFYDGGEDAQELSKGVDTEADRFEIDLARTSKMHDIPLLGICRGLQVINVAFGGTIVPDLGPGRVHNDSPVSDDMTDHSVRVESGTRLAEAVPPGSLPIRSSHHQAIQRAAPEFIISAVADDGVIEAIEAPDGCWIVAVQWHPEDPGARHHDFESLSRSFIEAARERRRRK